MKKLGFAIAGLLVILFITGHFLVFKIALISVKHELKEAIFKDLKNLEKIEIPADRLYLNTEEIKWQDNSSELLIADNIYDVVYIRTIGKKAIIYVVADEPEKKLLKKFRSEADLLFGRSGSQEEDGDDVLEEFLTLEFRKKNTWQFSSLQTEKTIISTYVLFELSSGYITIQTPPPLV